MAGWQEPIQKEFERATQARAKGNEGQARVCARRAAGIAIREYLTRRGIHSPSTSAVDLLNLIKDDPQDRDQCQATQQHAGLFCSLVRIQPQAFCHEKQQEAPNGIDPEEE